METPAWFAICAEEGICPTKEKEDFHSESILIIIDETKLPHEKEVKKKWKRHFKRSAK